MSAHGHNAYGSKKMARWCSHDKNSLASRSYMVLHSNSGVVDITLAMITRCQVTHDFSAISTMGRLSERQPLRWFPFFISFNLNKLSAAAPHYLTGRSEYSVIVIIVQITTHELELLLLRLGRSTRAAG